MKKFILVWLLATPAMGAVVKIKDANLAKQLKGTYFACGDPQLHGSQKSFKKNFQGTRNAGFLITKLIDPRVYFEQSAALATEKFKQWVKAELDRSRLIMVNGREIFDLGETIEVTVAADQSIADCMAQGPRKFQCGSSLDKRSCCTQGFSKGNSVTVSWRDLEGHELELKYLPGSGSRLAPAGNKSRDAIRYCILTEQFAFK